MIFHHFKDMNKLIIFDMFFNWNWSLILSLSNQPFQIFRLTSSLIYFTFLSASTLLAIGGFTGWDSSVLGLF